MDRVSSHLEDLWKKNQEAYRTLEGIRNRLKDISSLLRDAKEEDERLVLDREYDSAHREWDLAFRAFMLTNQRFREATARVADEHEAHTRQIRDRRPAS